MKDLSFAGGVHPSDQKLHTRFLKIEDFPAPQTLILPLSQHIGAPSVPLVKAGDRVLMGQKIADAGGAISACLHSPVSGTVVEIKPCLHPTGAMVNSIIIDNDGNDETAPAVLRDDTALLSPEEIVAIVKEAGIVGMGGAAFPTHVKLSPPPGKEIDYCIINGAECEPYLTSDHRVMLETPELVVDGCKTIMRAVGAAQAFIAIESNKLDAIGTMRSYTKNEENIAVVALEVKYPQGAEKQLIKAVVGREVPAGRLPMDIGVVVNNIDTCVAVSCALRKGAPLISRIVTVSGGAFNVNKNYRVRIGTQVKHLIQAAGGYKEEPARLILGGPMMGMAIYSEDVPITKGTGGLLALTAAETAVGRDTPCLRCGKCVEACPMRLNPMALNMYAKNRDLESCEKYNIADCMECGACTYICPGRRHPVQRIRAAKQLLIQQKK